MGATASNALSGTDSDTKDRLDELFGNQTFYGRFSAAVLKSRLDMGMQLVYSESRLSNQSSFFGYTCNGEREGIGMCVYNNGDIYVGEWRNGCCDGWGVYLRENGDSYEGSWSNNKRHGCGMLVQRNQPRYFGQFEMNERHGRAVSFQSNGNLYAERWERDQCTWKQPVLESSQTFAPQNNSSKRVHSEPQSAKNASSNNFSSNFENPKTSVSTPSLVTNLSRPKQTNLNLPSQNPLHQKSDSKTHALPSPFLTSQQAPSHPNQTSRDSNNQLSSPSLTQTGGCTPPLNSVSSSALDHRIMVVLSEQFPPNKNQLPPLPPPPLKMDKFDTLSFYSDSSFHQSIPNNNNNNNNNACNTPTNTNIDAAHKDDACKTPSHHLSLPNNQLTRRLSSLNYYNKWSPQQVITFLYALGLPTLTSTLASLPASHTIHTALWGGALDTLAHAPDFYLPGPIPVAELRVLETSIRLLSKLKSRVTSKKLIPKFSPQPPPAPCVHSNRYFPTQSLNGSNAGNNNSNSCVNYLTIPTSPNQNPSLQQAQLPHFPPNSLQNLKHSLTIQSQSPSVDCTLCAVLKDWLLPPHALLVGKQVGVGGFGEVKGGLLRLSDGSQPLSHHARVRSSVNGLGSGRYGALCSPNVTSSLMQHDVVNRFLPASAVVLNESPQLMSSAVAFGEGTSFQPNVKNSLSASFQLLQQQQNVLNLNNNVFVANNEKIDFFETKIANMGVDSTSPAVALSSPLMERFNNSSNNPSAAMNALQNQLGLSSSSQSSSTNNKDPKKENGNHQLYSHTQQTLPTTSKTKQTSAIPYQKQQKSENNINNNVSNGNDKSKNIQSNDFAANISSNIYSNSINGAVKIPCTSQQPANNFSSPNNNNNNNSFSSDSKCTSSTSPSVSECSMSMSAADNSAEGGGGTDGEDEDREDDKPPDRPFSPPTRLQEEQPPEEQLRAQRAGQGLSSSNDHHSKYKKKKKEKKDTQETLHSLSPVCVSVPTFIPLRDRLDPPTNLSPLVDSTEPSSGVAPPPSLQKSFSMTAQNSLAMQKEFNQRESSQLNGEDENRRVVFDKTSFSSPNLRNHSHFNTNIINNITPPYSNCKLTSFSIPPIVPPHFANHRPASPSVSPSSSPMLVSPLPPCAPTPQPATLPRQTALAHSVASPRPSTGNINNHNKSDSNQSSSASKTECKTIKVALKSFQSSASVRHAETDLLMEASILHRLQPCPHIVRLRGLTIHPFPILVTELSTSGSLFDVLHNRKVQLSLPVALSILWSVASALAFMHDSAKILHCDVKSANVLLDLTQTSPPYIPSDPAFYEYDKFINHQVFSYQNTANTTTTTNYHEIAKASSFNAIPVNCLSNSDMISLPGATTGSKLLTNRLPVLLPQQQALVSASSSAFPSSNITVNMANAAAQLNNVAPSSSSVHTDAAFSTRRNGGGGFRHALMKNVSNVLRSSSLASLTAAHNQSSKALLQSDSLPQSTSSSSHDNNPTNANLATPYSSSSHSSNDSPLLSPSSFIQHTPVAVLCDFGLSTAFKTASAPNYLSFSDRKLPLHHVSTLSFSSPCAESPSIDVASSPSSAPTHQTVVAPLNLGAIGTFNWMAPEVLRGEGYTTAADVYSLGMVIWEMFAGEVPFPHSSRGFIVGYVGFGGVGKSFEERSLKFSANGSSLLGGGSEGSSHASSSVLPSALYGGKKTRLGGRGGKGLPEKMKEVMRRCLEFEPRKRPSAAQVRGWVAEIYNECNENINDRLDEFLLG